ncbi:uncharacterized protein LOC134540077 isoform X2 [Bacillus rossius redtenbacheri]|uniref:uncharacterized protein LOC134540077 isoform X2 n=1 Tax=Bacillus rossius redtenbacheri TaxID=93214 RepID=UPI002FDD56FC
MLTVALTLLVLAAAATGSPTPHSAAAQQLFDSFSERDAGISCQESDSIDSLRSAARSLVRKDDEAVSEPEKAHFLKHHLWRTLDGTSSGGSDSDLNIPSLKIQELNSKLPGDFSSRLYDDVASRYGLPRKGVKRMVKEGLYCNGNGVCLSIEDIGSNCCDFDKGYDMSGLGMSAERPLADRQPAPAPARVSLLA